MDYVETPDIARERRKADAEARAKALVDHIGHFVNGMSHDQADAFASALANEHPTLLGQIAKAVGIGVVRRADYRDDWKPFDGFKRPLCTLPVTIDHIDHPEHDGRLDCTTVMGAILMARQGFI